ARVRSPLMAASATFALKVAVWFRRGRLFMVSPDSLGTACPLSGRNSTYRSVQISEASSALGYAVLEAHSTSRRLVLHVRGLNHIDAPMNLVLRSAHTQT